MFFDAIVSDGTSNEIKFRGLSFARLRMLVMLCDEEGIKLEVKPRIRSSEYDNDDSGWNIALNDLSKE